MPDKIFRAARRAASSAADLAGNCAREDTLWERGTVAAAGAGASSVSLFVRAIWEGRERWEEIRQWDRVDTRRTDEPGDGDVQSPDDYKSFPK